MKMIPLTEYSSKYSVSISTLRRRIKAENVRYRFEDGRYFLFDEPMEITPHASPLSPRPSPEPAFSEGPLKGPPSEKSESQPVIAAASKLLTELKSAYDLILKEKEVQILQLKQDAADLKTLIRILEQENEKMKRMFFEKWEQLPPSSSSSSSS